MRQYFRSRGHSFKFAFAGLIFVFRTQKNILIHSLATTAVLLLGAWLRLDRISWAILVLTLSTVWVAEFFNTALEALVDLASPDIHPLAKIAKDVGAAAVLLAALFSVLVGILILGPPLVGSFGKFF